MNWYYVTVAAVLYVFFAGRFAGRWDRAPWHTSVCYHAQRSDGSYKYPSLAAAYGCTCTARLWQGTLWPFWVVATPLRMIWDAGRRSNAGARDSEAVETLIRESQGSR
jgi:hypothetical protein